MKKAYITALFCLFTFSVFAQITPQDSTSKADSLKQVANAITVASATNLSNLLPQLTPKSPNVGNLGRYGEYPVSMFTGLANIEIPIFNVEVNGISMPVKLTYHASGNKVTDVASFVGLGWSLQYAGSINKQMRGMPDEVGVGLLGRQIPVDIRASVGAVCYNEDVRFAYEQMASNNIDTERDIFSLNIPSKSNQFILRDITDYQWLNPESSKIKYTRATNSFDITDEGGNQFTFDKSEQTVGSGTSAWLLTQVQGVRSQDKILVEYQAATTYQWTHDIMESVTINDNPTGMIPSGVVLTGPTSNPTPELISINNSVEQRLPQSIHFPSGKVEFVYETTDRQDGFGKALDKIEIYGYNISTLAYELIKTYDLTYVYRNRDNNANFPVLFLDKVRMLDNANALIGQYELGYNTAIPLPLVQSKALDYWGYYNGATTNTTRIPAQTIPIYQGGISTPTTINIGGANRQSDETNMKAWILNKITFPTGGYTVFDHEANQYLDGIVHRKAGGLRIKTITSSPNATDNPVVKSYRYGIGESGDGTLRQSLSFQYNTKQKVTECQSNTTGQPCSSLYTYDVRKYTSNLGGALFPHEGSPVTYSTVTEYQEAGATGDNGRTIYEFRESSDGQTTLFNGTKYFVQSKHWDRGQLARKRVFGKDNRLKYRQENTYTVLGAGSTTDICGRLLQIQNIYVNYRPSYLQGSSICYFETNDAQPAQTYFMNYGTTKLIKSEEFYYDNEDDTKFTQKTSITDYVPNYYFPRVTREIVNAGEIRGKKYFYPFDFGIIPTTKSGELLAIRRMQEKNELNIPIEEVSYRKNSLSATDSLISGAKLTSYYSREDNSVPGNPFSAYRLPSSIYLLESQLFNAFTTAYQPSSDLFLASPATYSADLPRHSLYDKKVTMNDYDVYGNLSEYTITHGGRKDSFGYQQYAHNGVQLNTLTGMAQDGFGLNHISNYAYTIPLLGLSSSQAANGVFTYFEYDSFGRFKTLKDHENKVLKEFAYDFSNRSVTEWMPRIAFTAVSNTTATSDATKTISFVDGLGRDLQKLVVNGSPDATKDIILSSVVYDIYGRGTKAYLPTPSTTGGGTFLTDVQTPAKAFYDTDDVPYTETTLFDKSPLNRPLTQYGAGNAWRTANKALTMQYKVAPTGTIKRFKASLGAVFCNVEGQPTTLEYYGSDELQMKVMLSERGNKTTEYIDLQGRTVQKDVEVSAGVVQSIIYVYDLFDRLSYVISPKAYPLFTSTRAFILDTETDFLEGIYAYKYDRKGQNILKHVAGHTGFEAMVYDQLYRLVLSRDAADDNVVDAFGRSRWKFSKFDALDRPAFSGLTFLTQGYSRQTLQDDFDNHTITSINETRVNTGGLLGYSNTSFPSNYTPLDANIRAVNYFDNYTWQLDNLFNFQSANAFGTQWANSKKGLMTGMLIRNVETLDWYKYVNYFDFKSRPLQSFALNHLGGIDRSEYQYRFNGEVLKMRTVHQGITEIYDYTFDHIGRKTSFKHSKDGVLQNVANYNYDGIGRMKTKTLKPLGSDINSKQTGNWTDVNTWLSGFLPSVSDNVTINTGHSVTIPSGQSGSAGVLNNKGTLQSFGMLNIGKVTTTDLQTVDFKYHIRGGLKGINLDANNNLTNKLFSFKLGYEEDGTYFDGNIRKQEWKSSIDNITRSYTYSYDGASRILSGAYASGKTGENYSLENMAYDFNGNITNLWRKGMTQNNTFDYIDKLNYTYATNSNKINSVSDAVSGNLNTGDFRDDNTSGNDYDYWADGSLKKDLNKGIDSIKYNYLKLPQRIKFSNGKWLEYQYDATGEKLKKKTSENKITDYISNLIFENNVLYQIGHDEGRIVNGNYEYNITDHLGNLRVAFKDSAGIAKITQAQDFEPFGLENWTSKYINNSKISNFKFNAKETQLETGFIDLGNRLLNPTIGRMLSVDKVSPLYAGYSTYGYCLNNPIKYVDIEGNFVIDAETARKYPALAFMVNNVLPNLVNNPKVLEALVGVSKKSDKINFIKSQMRSGAGPNIKVTQPPNSQNWQGTAVSESDGGHYAGNIDIGEKNNLYLNRVAVEKLESAAQAFINNNGKNGGGDLAVQMLSIGHTVTHEFAHFLLNALSGNHEEDSRGGNYEAGDDFSAHAFDGNTFHPNANQEKPGLAQFYNSNRNSSLMRGLTTGNKGLMWFITTNNSDAGSGTTKKKKQKSTAAAVGGANDSN